MIFSPSLYVCIILLEYGGSSITFFGTFFYKKNEHFLIKRKTQTIGFYKIKKKKKRKEKRVIAFLHQSKEQYKVESHAM